MNQENKETVALQELKKVFYDNTNKTMEDIQNRHKSIEELFTKSKSLVSEIQKFYNNTQTATSEIQSNKQTTTSATIEIQDCNTKSKQNVSEIEEQKQRSSSLMSELQKKASAINSLLSEVEKANEKSNNLVSEMQKQYDENSKIFEEKNKKLDQLTKKIENLLPGATTAGLASSYLEAQKEKNTVWLWAGFLGSLIALLGIYFSILSPNISLLGILIRTITGMPLIWIAWYCQKSMSQTKRIKEEYNHKERIMKVFEGFSKQIDILTENNPEQNKEKKLALISVVIGAIQKNPSEILNPSETFLDSSKNKINEYQDKLNNTLAKK